MRGSNVGWRLSSKFRTDTLGTPSCAVGIGKQDDRGHRSTGEMRRPTDAWSIGRSVERSRTDDALGVDRTEAGMWLFRRSAGGPWGTPTETGTPTAACG
jgi:hypothetical protein